MNRCGILLFNKNHVYLCWQVQVASFLPRKKRFGVGVSELGRYPFSSSIAGWSFATCRKPWKSYEWKRGQIGWFSCFMMMYTRDKRAGWLLGYVSVIFGRGLLRPLLYRDYETCSMTKQGFKCIKHVVYFPIIWGGYPFEYCSIVVQFNQLDTTK